jgi:hypothetical protein
MRLKSLVATLAVATAVAATSAGAAFAGEITGNGTPLWTGTDPVTGDHTLHGRSACAFSGREDAAGSPLRTQTPHAVWFGPGVGIVSPAPGTPGVACNPIKSAG